jgi:hypothetical protein
LQQQTRDDPEDVGDVEGVAEVHRDSVAQLVAVEETEEEGVELYDTLDVVEAVPLELAVPYALDVRDKLAVLHPDSD